MTFTSKNKKATTGNSAYTLLENRYVKVLALLLALIYSLYEYSWGLWIIDNYYWINSSKLWKETPMTILSLWSMNVWHDLFGQTLIANRMLAWVLNSMTVFLACWIFINKQQRKEYWYYLCGAFIILGPGIAKICTPECQSSLLVLLLIGCIWSYRCSDHKIVWLILLSTLTALVVAFRFPNIVSIPFIMVYLLMETIDRRKGVMVAVTYLILSLLLYWAIMAIAMDTTNVVGEISESFRHASEASNGRHSIIGLLLRYCKSILLSLIACMVIWGVWKSVDIMKNKQFIVRYVLPSFVGIIILYLIYNLADYAHHSWTVCLPSILAISLVYCAFKEWKWHNYYKTNWLLFLTAMLFVPSAGSDTGFYKSIILTCAFAPYAISVTSQYVEKSKIAMTFIIVLITSMSFCNQRAYYHRYTTDIKPMRHILWEKWKIEDREKLNKDIEPFLRKGCTTFYGIEAHYLYCATGNNIPCNSFWMDKNDIKEINRITVASREHHQKVLIDLTKSDTCLFVSRGLRLKAEEEQFNVYEVK